MRAKKTGENRFKKWGNMQEQTYKIAKGKEEKRYKR